MPSAYQELTLRATKMQTWRTGARGCETNFGQLHRCAHRRAPLQRSMQHSRAGTGAEPTQQHPTPPGPGRRTTQLFVGGAQTDSPSGWAFPSATGSQKPAVTEDLQIPIPPVAARRAACSHAAAHFRLHAAQRTARTKGHGAAGPPPPHPTPHPRSVIGAIHGQLRRCPRTAPRGAQQRPRTAPHRRTPPRTAPAGTRCCRGAGISRSREAKSRPAEALILNLFFSSCPARRGAEGCSNAPRISSAAPGGHGRGPRREDTRTRRVCRYRRAISQRGHTHPHGDTHSSTLRGCSVTSAEREGRKRKTGAGAAERPDPTPHRRCSRGERR